MKKFLKSILKFVVLSVTLTSCTTINKSLHEPYTKLELYKSDLSFSPQVSAEASSTKVLGIDWSRLFLKKTGTVQPGSATQLLTSILLPIIGNISGDLTSNYALYTLMVENPGYDIILYPQYETKVTSPVGIGFLYKETTVKVTARLGKFTD